MIISKRISWPLLNFLKNSYSSIKIEHDYLCFQFEALSMNIIVYFMHQERNVRRSETSSTHSQNHSRIHMLLLIGQDTSFHNNWDVYLKKNRRLEITCTQSFLQDRFQEGSSSFLIVKLNICEVKSLFSNLDFFYSTSRT